MKIKVKVVTLAVDLNKSFAVPCVMGLILSLVSVQLGSETLTFSTTYPSPSGIYRTIVTTGGNPGAPVDTVLARNAGNVYIAAGGGNVGIGTNTPAARLEVNGNMQVDGNAVLNSLTLNGPFNTGFAANIGGALWTGGNFNASGSAGISNGLWVGGNANVAGSQGISNSLWVGGNANVSGSQGISNQLWVGSDASVSGSLNVGGYVRGGTYGFGGIFTMNDDGSCRYGNPYTGWCSCPGGFWASPFSEFWNASCAYGLYSDGWRTVNCGIVSYQCVR